MSHDLTDDEADERHYHQDPAWYRPNGSMSYIVWKKDDHDLYVVAVGEMKIIITTPDGEKDVLFDTDDIKRFGITNDKELFDYTEDEENFYWAENPWFEIWSKSDNDYYTDAYHELDEAIEAAIELEKEER